MYSWTTEALVKSLLPSDEESADKTESVAAGVRNFLERVYYEGDPRDVPIRSTVTLRRAAKALP
jgi:hypothetical protein